MDVNEIIERLGGTGIVAAWLRIAPGAVSNWKTRKSIPSWHWKRLCALATERGVEGITLEELASVGR